MKVAHIALWTRQLETQAHFWVDFFAGSVNEKYCSQTNPIIETNKKPGRCLALFMILQKPCRPDKRSASGFFRRLTL
ncbi:hypothetical protein DFQ50_101722 [Pseudocitrobacter faecalis]|uniref:Lactoylglutathione lyase n=1 Tax=Pseudocitrobacter faecalis TaxID=1398493 RepID=A0ABX9G4L0_9ENTR|nr:hypothetical protein DFQ50_101722 [Pseudocitrobacter faecalis]